MHTRFQIIVVISRNRNNSDKYATMSMYYFDKTKKKTNSMMMRFSDIYC